MIDNKEINALVGEKVANLVITKVIGSGSYGAVYVAENPVRTKFAVKCLFKSGLSPEHLVLQKQEIFINRKLGFHKNIVSLEDVIETNDHLFLVFEYCSRGDLFELIRQEENGIFDKSLVKDLFLQLLSGMEHCHRLSVYHRDLKPENVLISSDWAAKVGDFGLASSNRLCKEFECGSGAYMAPESFERSTVYYDAAKADVWSLGVILFNMLFGVNPWAYARSSDPLFAGYLANPFESLTSRFPLMTPELAQLFLQVFEVDFRRRPTMKRLTRLVKCTQFSLADSAMRFGKSFSSSLKVSSNKENVIPKSSVPEIFGSFANSWADDDLEMDYNSPIQFTFGETIEELPEEALNGAEEEEKFGSFEEHPSDEEEEEEDVDEDDAFSDSDDEDLDVDQLVPEEGMFAFDAPVDTPPSARAATASATPELPTVAAPAAAAAAAAPSIVERKVPEKAPPAITLSSTTPRTKVQHGFQLDASESPAVSTTPATAAASQRSRLSSLISAARDTPSSASSKTAVDELADHFDLLLLPSVANKVALTELAKQLDSHQPPSLIVS